MLIGVAGVVDSVMIRHYNIAMGRHYSTASSNMCRTILKFIIIPDVELAIFITIQEKASEST